MFKCSGPIKFQVYLNDQRIMKDEQISMDESGLLIEGTISIIDEMLISIDQMISHHVKRDVLICKICCDDIMFMVYEIACTINQIHFDIMMTEETNITDYQVLLKWV